LLYQVCDQIRQHAGNRPEALLPLIKGSQAAIMAVTADLDLTLSPGRILLELERTGEALAVNDLASRISLSIAAAGRALRCESAII
jgi:DNA-binding MarR family transcriptional regulator